MISKSISELDGEKLDSYILILNEEHEGRFPEEINFKFRLRDPQKEISKNSVVWGKHFSGRGRFYTPWLEIDFADEIEFDSGLISLSEGSLDENLFRTMADLLPPGGRIIVIYADHDETEEGLRRGIPAPATRIGFLLYRSGCVWFKDWYFPEGKKEGRVKLQGEKPMDDEKRRGALLEVLRELEEFLEREGERSEGVFKRAKLRSDQISEEIIQEFPRLEDTH